MSYDEYDGGSTDGDYEGDRFDAYVLVLLLAGALLVGFLLYMLFEKQPAADHRKPSLGSGGNVPRKQMPDWTKSELAAAEPEPERHPEEYNDHPALRSLQPPQRRLQASIPDDDDKTGASADDAAAAAAAPRRPAPPKFPPGQDRIPLLWAHRASQCDVLRHPYPVYRVCCRTGIHLSSGPGHEFDRASAELQYGEQFAATATFPGPDQRLYLRLADGRGWAYDDAQVLPDDPSVELIMEQAGSLPLRSPPDEPPSEEVLENPMGPNPAPSPEDPLAGFSPRTRVIAQNWGVVRNTAEREEAARVKVPGSLADWVNEQMQLNGGRSSSFPTSEDFGGGGIRQRGAQGLEMM